MATSTVDQRATAAAASAKAKASLKRTAAAWMISRHEQGQWLRCYWHESGQKQEMWALPLPSPESIAERWGSGQYKLTLLSAKGQVCGSQRLPAIDDPDRPSKPTYPNPPGRTNGKPVAAPAAPDPLQAMLAGGAGPQIQAMLQGIELYTRLDYRNRERADAEADRRMARYQADSQLQMQREREWFDRQQKQNQQFYERLSTLSTAPQDDLREDLEEQIEEIRAQGGRAEDDGDPKTALVRLVKDKVSEIPTETIVDVLKGLGESLKKK